MSRAGRFALAALAVLAGQHAPAQQDVTTLVSVNPDGVAGSGASSHPSVSADGRFVAFQSLASDLVPGDTNGTSDVFVRDLLTGVTTRVSLSTAGDQADEESEWPSISADGRFVAFESEANNLVPGDISGQRDIFVHDRALGTTVQVNVTTFGVDGNNWSAEPAISGDGSRVAFRSSATNLAPFDNSAIDVYVHVLGSHKTLRVSNVQESAAGFTARSPSLSADGLRMSWQEECEVIIGCNKVLLRDFTASTTTKLIDYGVENSESMISTDGQLVAYWQVQTYVVNADTHEAGSVSVTPAGLFGPTIGRPAISADGRFVAFTSYAYPPDVWPGASDGNRETFVRDRLLGVTTAVSVNAAAELGDGDSGEFNSLSADGRYAAYSSSATNLVANDGNGLEDVFIHAPIEPWVDLGFALPGAAGAPKLLGVGPLHAGTQTSLALTAAAPGAPALLLASLGSAPAPFKGGTLAALPPIAAVALAINGAGQVLLSFSWPGGVPPATQLTLQYAIADAGAVQGVALSNAVEATAP